MRRETSTGAARQPDIGYRCPSPYTHATPVPPLSIMHPVLVTDHSLLFLFSFFFSFFLFVDSNSEILEIFLRIGKFLSRSKFEIFYSLKFENFYLLYILFSGIWKFFSVFYSLKFGNFFEVFLPPFLFFEIFKISILSLYSILWNLKILLCILFPEIWKFLWNFPSRNLEISLKFSFLPKI